MPALIFDCDGVLADTERFGHLPAFNQTFAEFGVPVQWSEDEYADLLRIGGGKERMASILTPDFVERTACRRSEAEQADLVATWHRRKTAIYTERVAVGRHAAAARHTPARRSRPPRQAGSSRSPRPRPSRVGAVGPGPRRRRRRWRVASRSSPGTSCRARSLPRTSTCSRSTSWASTRHRSSSSRTAATACSRRSTPDSPAWSRRAATPATRTSPAPPWWSPAWATRDVGGRRGPAEVLADPYDVLSRPFVDLGDPRGVAATRVSLTTQQGPCP